MIYFIIFYSIFLLSYLVIETKGIKPLRAFNKMVLSFGFLSYGLVMFFMHYSYTSFEILLPITLLLASLGDLFLLFRLGKGVAMFFGCNIVFSSYLLIFFISKNVPLLNYLWAIIAFVIIMISVGIFLYMSKKTYSKAILIGYLASITLSGFLGLALIINFKETKYLLIGLGLILFMLSDYAFTINKFYIKNNFVLRTNSFLYFTGMLLIVLGMGI